MLKVENINLSFDNLVVLKDISFEINNREIVVIIGPSGCGKSTLLNIIAGVLEVDNGKIELSQDKIGFVFQDDRLLPWKTVYDNIRVVNDNGTKEEINQLIVDVGLKGFEKYYPNQLSGGMKKRCGVARAFFYKSELLLMDEPFQGLDFYLRKEMIDMLLDIWQSRKQSIIFITHELDEALSVANRILVLSSRPATIIKEIVLPPYNERKIKKDTINEIRDNIISLIT